MVAVQETNEQLRDTDGFLVESPEGDVGWVEEIWVGEGNEPRALAVQTVDGRHALLPAEEVVAVEREQHWVVVAPEPELLELAPPRLVDGDHVDSSAQVAASWSTTGAPLTVPARPSWRRRRQLARAGRAAVRQEDADQPVWPAIAVLYTALAFVVAFVITLAFVIARLVTGSAY